MGKHGATGGLVGVVLACALMVWLIDRLFTFVKDILLSGVASSVASIVRPWVLMMAWATVMTTLGLRSYDKKVHWGAKGGKDK